MQPESATATGFAGTRRFTIERELGSGGMGVVYEATDHERNARVALKALTQRDALNIYRLKNEFRQLADLSHPNLVALHELCCENGSWFFTMELVEGVTFDLYVTHQNAVSSIPPAASDPRSVPTVAGRMVRDVSTTLSQRAIGSEYPIGGRATCNVRRLRRVLRQLVEAVAALHNAGKLHRDLKPSNVLVTPEERVVVLDFGLVSNSTLVEPEPDAAERTVGGCVFGTPAYMSPEQAAGEAVTPASDWYAIGVMLYEALTGQLPFDGSVLEILRQKETLEPAPPSTILSSVPDDLDELCRDLLRRDPLKRPTGPEIVRRLTGHADAPRVLDAQSSATDAQTSGELFVGREAHLAALREAFNTAKSGQAVTVFVHGVSGMGKSALVRCFANELIQRDEAVVLRGRCYERESVPYKAFDTIIDALSRYLMRLPPEQAATLLPRNVHSLARLFPVLRRVRAIAHARTPKHQPIDDVEMRNQAFAALKELLLRITDFQPLVLNIDDLQWADMDSARLLTFLLGRPDPPPLLLVGAYRRDEAANSPFLRYVLGDTGLHDNGCEVRELAVDPLSMAEAKALCATLLSDLPTTSALASEGIGLESEGVPFFITELVQHVRALAGRGEADPSVQTLALKDVVLERVRALPRDAQRLLEALSVAAGPIEQGVAMQAAALPTGDRSALLALRAARLIRTRGTRQTDAAEVYHDRVRETVVATMHPEAVRLTHARLASAIESFGISDPERLVVHYSAAGDGIRAGETAVQAAHGAAQKLAFHRAAELFRRAISLHAADDSHLPELHQHMATALANAGWGAQAAEAFLHAAKGVGPSEARKLRRLAAQQYLRSGRLEEGCALARRLFAEVGLDFPETTARALLSYGWNRARLSMRGYQPDAPREPVQPLTHERLATLETTFREIGTFDIVRGAALRTQFRRYAQQAGDTERVMHAMAWDAWTAAITARSPEPALRMLARVESLAEHVGTPYATATAKSARAGCALFLRRMGEVVGPATEAEALYRASCPGTHWEAHVAVTYRYAAIEQVGGFKAMLDETPGRMRELMDRDDRFGIAVTTLFVVLGHLVQDSPEDAKQFLLEQRERLTGPYGMFGMWLTIRTAHTLLYSGEGSAALEHMTKDMVLFEKSAAARGRFYATTMHSLMARCCIAAARERPNERRALIAKAERCARLISDPARPHSEILSRMLLAEIAFDRRDPEAARRHLQWCADSAPVNQARMLGIYAKRALGTLLGGDEGRGLVRDADETLLAEGVHNPQSFARIWVDLPKR